MDPSDNINIVVQDTSIVFMCGQSTKGEGASVEWSQVTRVGAEVRFDIRIDDFFVLTPGDSGFKLTVYEDTTLHILADGKSAEWMNGDSVIAKSHIFPGSGSHKARIKQTVTGFEIYEDGMKSGLVDLASPSHSIATKFATTTEDAGLRFFMSITNLRMDPVPSGTSNEDDSTDASIVVY